MKERKWKRERENRFVPSSLSSLDQTLTQEEKALAAAAATAAGVVP